MLEYLRELVRLHMSDINEIAQATGTGVSELRQFANGLTILDGLKLDQLATYFRLELRPLASSNLLPLEREESRAVQRKFALSFDDAGFVLRLARGVIGSNSDGTGELPKIQKPRGLTWPLVHLCMGLYSKSLKHFRAV